MHPWGLNDDDNDGWETGSKKSVTSRKSTAAFFYPPLTPPATSSKHAISEPLVVPPVPPPPPTRHPYQTAYAPGSYDYHSSSTPPITSGPSHTQLHHHGATFTTSTTSAVDVYHDRSSRGNNGSGTVNHVPPGRHSSAQHQQHVTLLRSVLLFLLFLPVPPLLSLLYLIIGHAILRSSHPPHSSWSSHTLLSSVNAGATGGIILSLPLFLVFYPLFSSQFLHTSRTREPPPSQPQPQPQLRPQPRIPLEDFFSDSSSSAAASSSSSFPSRKLTHLILTSVKYVTCLLLVLGVGSAAGALGVTCLGGSGTHKTQQQRHDQLLLSPGDAAQAGIVGALVFWPGVAILAGVIGTIVFWARTRIRTSGKKGAKTTLQRGEGEGG